MTSHTDGEGGGEGNESGEEGGEGGVGGGGGGMAGDGGLVWPSSATAAACTLAAESTGSHCGATALPSDRRRASADGLGGGVSKKSQHPHSCQPSLVQPFTVPESRV